MTKLPRPTQITLHKRSRMLDLTFDDNSQFQLSCEYLRVYSPSAEVRGHGPGQEKLQTGKEKVNIEKIESVGSYAIKLFFDDGHNTGIYSWETLYDLGSNHEEYWNSYIKKLSKAGFNRIESA